MFTSLRGELDLNEAKILVEEVREACTDWMVEERAFMVSWSWVEREEKALLRPKDEEDVMVIAGAMGACVTG